MLNAVARVTNSKTETAPSAIHLACVFATVTLVFSTESYHTGLLSNRVHLAFSFSVLILVMTV